MGRNNVGVFAQQTPHFFVGRLIEVEVPLSDGRKRLRCTDTDDLIGNRRELIACLTGADGNGNDDRRRAQLPHCFDRSPHRRTGSQAIVDENGDAPFDRYGFASLTIRALPPHQFALFLSRYRLDRVVRDAVPSHDVVVEHSDTARCDGSHGQLAMPGGAEFAHKKQVKRGSERPSHFVRDWHSTARKRKDNDVAAARIFVQSRA